MARFAVAYVSLFESDLSVEIIEAPNWMVALMKHSKIDGHWALPGPEFTWTTEGIQKWFFDNDALVAVKEIL